MIDSPLPPIDEGLQVGLNLLDVELARLAAACTPESAVQPRDAGIRWLQWAVALVSQAHGRGHTCLQVQAGAAAEAELSSLTVEHSEQGNASARRLAIAKDWLGQWPRWRSLAQDHPFLVLEGERLYLRRLWHSETEVAERLLRRARRTESLRVDLEPLLQAWLPSSESAPSEDQQEACRAALGRNLTVITGGPGTGKTHTAARLIALLQAGGRSPGGEEPLPPPGRPPKALRIGLAAPTGKAAARLRQALEQAWQTLPRSTMPAEFWEAAWAGVEAPVTVHTLLARAERHQPWTVGQAPCLPLDVLIIDEASMLDLELLERLLKVLPEQARLVLIGDREQLSSVEAGAVMADLCEGLKGSSVVVSLKHSRRFQGPIGRCAAAVRDGKPVPLHELNKPTPEPGEAKADPDGVAVLDPESDQGPAGPKFFDLVLGQGGFGPLYEQLQVLRGRRWSSEAAAAALLALERFRMLCALRRGPWGAEALNRSIELELARRGLMRLQSPWTHGQVLMATRNDPQTGLSNGDVGLVLEGAAAEPARWVWLQGQEVRQVACARVAHAEPAWAMTVHKSQGSEFAHVALVLPAQESPVLSRELLYTGITRAREQLTLVARRTSVMDAAASRPTVRMSGLAWRLSGARPGEA